LLRLPRYLSLPRDVAFWLVSTFCLLACNDPNQVGRDVLPDLTVVNIDSALSVSLAVEKGSDYLSDHKISSITLHPVGQLNDPVSGTLIATSYTQLGLSGDNLTFSVNNFPVKLDTLYLELVTSVKYGNSSNLLRLDVHELAEVLDTSQRYRTTSSVAVTGANLVESPNPFTVNRGAQTETLRFALSPALGQRLLTAPAEVYQNTASFIRFFRGLRIQVFSVNPLDPGAILTYQISQSALVLAYTEATTEGSVKQRARLPFGATGTARFYAFNRQVAPQSLLARILDSTSLSRENRRFAYIQDNDLYRTRLTIHGLRSLTQRSVHRAELDVLADTTQFGADNAFVPVALVSLLNRDQSRLLGNALYNPNIGGYRLDLRSVFQNFALNPTTADSVFYLEGRFYPSSSPVSAAHRVVLCNAAHPTRKPRISTVTSKWSVD
jgi:hypothetical protein